MIRRALPLIVAAALALGSVGCSGGAQSKPSVDEVSTALAEVGVPEALTDCIADEIHGELSSSVLKRLVDDGIDAEGTDDELADVTEAVQSATTACMDGVDLSDLADE